MGKEGQSKRASFRYTSSLALSIAPLKTYTFTHHSRTHLQWFDRRASIKVSSATIRALSSSTPHSRHLSSYALALELSHTDLQLMFGNGISVNCVMKSTAESRSWWAWLRPGGLAWYSLTNWLCYRTKTGAITRTVFPLRMPAGDQRRRRRFRGSRSRGRCSAGWCSSAWAWFRSSLATWHLILNGTLSGWSSQACTLNW